MALAAFRLTRVATTDDFPPVQAARDWVIERAGKDSALAEMIRCPWCSGWWVSLAIISAAVRKPPWRLTFRDWMLVAALSASTGLLSTADSALGRLGQ